jgi:hypothetical protein
MAAISVQQGGGGDYTTLEAAVEAFSTADGDVITISGTWTIREDTRIAVSDALTIVATGDSKQIGRPWRTGDTHYQHRSTSAGHSFTITDTGAVTFEDLDIILDHTGVSDEIFRNNVSNTFTARRCLLGFAVRTDQQDVYYNEAVSTALFEQCHFYNAYRAVCDIFAYDTGSTIKFNSCTGYDIGYSTGGSTRSGVVGMTGSTNTLVVDMFNCIFHINTGSAITGHTSGATLNCYTVVTNQAQISAGGAGQLDTNTDNTVNAAINDTDSSGNYILIDTTTSPYDLRLFDNATNNAAQDHSTNATGLGLTIPSTDIVGTSRPQNTNYDIGAFEVVASTGAFTLTAASGGYTYSGTAATLAAGKILTADTGAYAYTGTAAELLQGFSLAADSGAYSYSGTAAGLTKGSILAADSGTYTYSGTSAGLLADYSLSADTAGYAYTGTAAVLTFASAGNFTLTADNGVYSYSGTIAALTADRVLVGSSGGYAYSGTTATLSKGFSLAVDSGSYTYTGANVDFSTNAVLNALSANYVYNGTNVNLLYTPIGPDIPTADGLTVSGSFGNGVAFTANFGNGAAVTSSFGNGVSVKGKL